MSTHDSLTQFEADELVSLAQKARTWQEQRGYSDTELLRRMPGLGSTKTFSRILRRDLTELDLDRWISEYRAVIAVIESLSGREQKEVDLYEDMSTVVQLRRALVEIIEEKSIRRVVLVEADSGLGKSSGITLLQRKYGQAILVVEALIAWRDNPNSFVGAVLEALGVTDLPLSSEARMRMVLAKLRTRSVTLAIDEAHDLGPRCLDTVKTLINQTPTRVVLFAWPTLWRRLERGAFEETRQLLGNRLAERIKIGALREADVRRLLERRAGVADDKAATAKLLEAAPTRGNLSFVDAVCARLARAERDGKPTHEEVLAAIAAEVARR